MKLTSIYLPKKDNNKKSLNKINRKLQNDLINCFGGLTSYDGTGAWLDNKTNKFYNEPVTVFNIACSNTIKSKNIINDLAVKYKKLANQEAIFTAFNGTVRIVS